MSLCVLHSRLMAGTYSQAQMTRQFRSGMQRWGSQWQSHSEDTQIGSCLLHSHLIVGVYSQAQTMREFGSEMQRQGSQWQTMINIPGIEKRLHVRQ